MDRLEIQVWELYITEPSQVALFDVAKVVDVGNDDSKFVMADSGKRSTHAALGADQA